jgi:hypothetical protein
MRSSVVESAFTSTEARAPEPLCDSLRLPCSVVSMSTLGSGCMKHGAAEVQVTRSRDNHYEWILRLRSTSVRYCWYKAFAAG